jgi:hypothetical protein
MYVGNGESRTIVWECRYGGSLVDCDIDLAIYSGMGYDEYTPDRVSTGVYRYTYTHPADSNESTYVVFNLDAAHTADDGRVSEDFDYHVIYHNTMIIWAKSVKYTETGATFDLYVSHMDGKPAGGSFVEVEVDYSKENETWWDEDIYNATTDIDGVARLEIVYDDMAEDEYYVEIEGTVTWREITQEVAFNFVTRDPPDEGPWEPPEYGLHVEPERTNFDFDKSYTYQATAYLTGEVLMEEPVYCYLVTDHDVVAHTNTTTGADGKLSFDFSTPKKGQDDYVSGDAGFKCRDEGSIYSPYQTERSWFSIGQMDLDEEDGSFMEAMEGYRTDELSLETDKVEKGKSIGVRYNHPDVGETWDGVIILGNDPNPKEPGRMPLWTFWSSTNNKGSSPYNGGGFYYEQCERKDGQWRCTIMIPENMPDDGYFLWAYTYRTDTWDFNRENMKTNLVSLKVGEAANSDTDDDGPGIAGLSWPMLMAIVVLVIIILVGVVMMRRRKTEEAPPVGLAPSGLPPAEVSQETPSGWHPQEPPAQVPPPPEQAYQPPPEQAYQPPPEQVYQPPPEQAYQPPPEQAYQPPPEQAYQPPPEQAYQPPPEQAYQPPPEQAYQPPPEQAYQPPPEQAAPPPPAEQAPPSAPVDQAIAAATMMIRCQNCDTAMQVPTTRPLDVTCPSCGISWTLR